MAASRTSVAKRVAAWRHALSPWLAALKSHLSIVVPTLPDRDAIARHLWIRFAVPDQTESVGWQAARDAEHVWLEWLEAFELLDLLARVDLEACWTVLLETCDAGETLRHQACPVEFFYGVQPRYELRFAHKFAPTDRVEALLSGGPRKSSSPAFAETKSQLLVAMFPGSIGEDLLAKALRLSPIRLRYWFALPGLDGFYADPNVQIRTYNETVRFLKRVLALAKCLRTKRRPRTSDRFFVGAFDFEIPVLVEVRDGVRTLLKQIANHMPIFSLTYRGADRYGRNLFGPFLWTMMPSASRGPAFGLRKLAVSAYDLPRECSAAFAASIAHNTSLREFSLLDDSSRWSWASCLAFALFQKNATHQIHTVQLYLSAQGVQAMTRVLTTENPVAYAAAVLDGGGSTKAYTRFPLTKVRVRAETPVLHHTDSRAFEVKTISDGTDDVECYVAGQEYGEFIRVLAPGVGFCCVRRTDVLSEFPDEEKATHPVRSLTLRVSSVDMNSLASLLEVIGGPLTKLVLSAKMSDALCLDAVLAACPRLKRLELSNMMLQEKSLIPIRGGNELESLTLSDCNIVHDGSHRLRVVSATTFPRLATLALSLRGVAHTPRFAEFLVRLAVARDVQRLIVHSDHEAMKDEYRCLLKQHGVGDGDHIHALPLRHKLAVLSAVTSHRRLALDCDTITLIFEMLAPTTRRRICTFVG